MTNDGRWRFTWDGENRLVALESLPGVPEGSKRRLTFQYDPQGRRILKAVQAWTNSAWTIVLSNRFTYDGWNLIAELNATNNAIIRSYVWGLDLSGTEQGAGGVGGLLAISDQQSAIHFAAYDGNGNVLALVNATDGTVSANYEYGPFAELLRATGPMATINPIVFSTKYHDAETGFLYYGYRYYDPATGRWLNRDPLGEAANSNTYAAFCNSATDGMDYLGLLNIIRLGFKGAGGTEGNWLPANVKKFGAQAIMPALWFIFKQLDSNKDGIINDCDDEAQIRVTGFSWGAWSAIQLARIVHTTTVIQSAGTRHRKVVLGLLDPVSTARGGTADLSPNVVFALNVYQRNGCYKGRCPGPSSWYKGVAVNGAMNLNVTTYRPVQWADGVPLAMTPDHVHLMSDYPKQGAGFATMVGMIHRWP
jgi:RHS repeat-associated protein